MSADDSMANVELAAGEASRAVVTSPLTRLAVAAQTGSASDHDLWLDQLQRLLVRVGFGLGISSEDLLDLVQETSYSAWRALATFDPCRGSCEAWAIAMLRRRAANWRRRLRRQLRGLARLTFERPTGPEPDAALGQVEDRATLERLLQALSPRQREVIAYYELAELSADEVANLLGTTAAGVRSVARDAREQLTRAAKRARPGVAKDER